MLSWVEHRKKTLSPWGLVLFTVECPDIAESGIQNGMISTPGGRSVGDIAYYMCDPCYSVVGVKKRTCLANGQWSGSSPTCEGKYRRGSSQHSVSGYHQPQSQLPRPIPRNSVESDHGCTSRIYFDNVGDKVTLTLYNLTLTSQKPC